MTDRAPDAGAELRPVPTSTVDGGSIQAREAIELLLEGKQVEALRAYRSLAARFPEQRAYGDVARILAGQLGDRCAATGEASACDGL